MVAVAIPGSAPDQVAIAIKHGTLFAAVSHIFCAIVGAGVLALPNAVSWLGWVAGPICICVFYAISLWSSLLLAQLYCVDGIEFSRYHHAVRHILGSKAGTLLSSFVSVNLVMVCIAYSITGALCMSTVAKLLGKSFSKNWVMTLIFGAVELVLSQLPSLAEAWWVSAIGSFTSLGYCAIALGLGLRYSGTGGGTLGGQPGHSNADKVFNVLGSLGNIAFAFSFALVLLEIQDTLRQPPKVEKTMGRAVKISVTSAFALCFSVAAACYAALGNGVPGQVLVGFPDAPDWLLIIANLFVVVHMMTAWQVFAQPMYETLETNIKAYVIKKRKRAADVYRLPAWQRLLIRSTYVLLCTLVAAVIPFFSAFISFVGAIAFWPLSIAFPFAMYTKVYKTRGRALLMMKAFAGVMLVVGLSSAIASFRSIVVSWSSYTLFE